MDETTAKTLAHAMAHADGISELPGYEWTSSRFTDGWLVTLRPSDPLSATGGHHFIVLDTGAVSRETGSLPPFEYVARHSAAGNKLTLAVEGGRLLLNKDGEVEFQPL